MITSAKAIGLIFLAVGVLPHHYEAEPMHVVNAIASSTSSSLTHIIVFNFLKSLLNYVLTIRSHYLKS